MIEAGSGILLQLINILYGLVSLETLTVSHEKVDGQFVMNHQCSQSLSEM